MKKYYCKDCEKLLSNYRSKRCKSCENKRRFKMGVMDGKSMLGRKQPHLVLYNKSHVKKGKDHPKFIDGRSLKPKYCPDCGVEIHWQSIRCGSCANTGDNNPSYINGKNKEPYPLEWTETLKESIRQRDGYICQLCGVPEVECMRKLSIHHIDYDKENINPENLVALCQSCHRKTNFNRECWKVFFKTKKEVRNEIFSSL